MAGYTLTPVAINVVIEGIPTIVAHKVQIQHSINDYSRCEVSVIARNNNEVVTFKEIFPTLAKAKAFTKMTVSVAIKSGPKNTLKQFNTIWSGTLTGITPSMSPGSVEFTLHGLGGLFYSGTVCLYSPGMFPGCNMGGGALTAVMFRDRICNAAATGQIKDMVDLFNNLVAEVDNAFGGFASSPILQTVNGQVKGMRFDLIKADLKKIRKVPGMTWPESLGLSDEGSSKGYSWLDSFMEQVLNQPQETFWTVYASACISLHSQLITIGDNVILAPAFWLAAPVSADRKYDPINPVTNVIYSEDLLAVSPGINPFDAPTRVGSFIGVDPPSEGESAGLDIYSSALNESAGFFCFPSSIDNEGMLPTITQQEELTGARILVVQPEHWLIGSISHSNFGRDESFEKGGCNTQKPKDRADDANKTSKAKQEQANLEAKANKLYVKSRYYKEVLAPRAGAVQLRLRLDCVPGLPCRVIAPWDAFTIDAYVISVTHSISTTPESASTVMQFTHARFLNEKIDMENPLYPGVSVKNALPVFEAAARGSASGEAAGTVDATPAKA